LDQLLSYLDLIHSHTDINLHQVNIAHHHLLQLLQTSNQVLPSSSNQDHPLQHTTVSCTTKPRHTGATKHPAVEEAQSVVKKKSRGGTSKVEEELASPGTSEIREAAPTSDLGPIASTMKVEVPQNQYQVSSRAEPQATHILKNKQVMDPDPSSSIIISYTYNYYR
jgi:hypothetical protein